VLESLGKALAQWPPVPPPPPLKAPVPPPPTVPIRTIRGVREGAVLIQTP